MLNNLQQVTLQAFIAALAELNSPLPADLQKQINQVGAIFSTQPNVAIDELSKLAKHSSINQLYLQARVNIQSEYEPKERNPNRDLEKEIAPNQNDDYSNNILGNRTKSVLSESVISEANEVLQAENSSAKAKQYIFKFQFAIKRIFS
ncbi:MAG: hypothetical protein WBF90_26495 [Rivularia sp. (in: cyanobacteria)]